MEWMCKVITGLIAYTCTFKWKNKKSKYHPYSNQPSTRSDMKEQNWWNPQENCCNATLSANNLTWSYVPLNWRLCGEKQWPTAWAIWQCGNLPWNSFTPSASFPNQRGARSLAQLLWQELRQLSVLYCGHTARVQLPSQRQRGSALVMKPPLFRAHSNIHVFDTTALSIPISTSRTNDKPSWKTTDLMLF